MISQRKIKQRATRKDNPELKELVSALRKKGAFWQKVATIIVKPKRQSVKVNLTKIDKETKEGETVVVPGKVLGSGMLSKKINLGAVSFSENALEKMKSAKIMELIKVADAHKDGKGVKVLQ